MTDQLPEHSPLGASSADPSCYPYGCLWTPHPSLPLWACMCGAIRNRRKVLKPRPDKDGYMICTFGPRTDPKTVKVHRVVLACFAGEDDREVDHIDRDRSNNWRFNLRYLTTAQNHRNVGPRRHSRSQIRNVRWREDKNKWQAYCTVAGRFKSLGHFDNADDAQRTAEAHYGCP